MGKKDDTPPPPSKCGRCGGDGTGSDGMSNCRVCGGTGWVRV